MLKRCCKIITEGNHVLAEWSDGQTCLLAEVEVDKKTGFPELVGPEVARETAQREAEDKAKGLAEKLQRVLAGAGSLCPRYGAMLTYIGDALYVYREKKKGPPALAAAYHLWSDLKSLFQDPNFPQNLSRDLTEEEVWGRLGKAFFELTCELFDVLAHEWQGKGCPSQATGAANRAWLETCDLAEYDPEHFFRKGE